MSKKRIFVVEDEPFIREDLVETLEELNYEVVGEAVSADEALGKISEIKELDIILLDISIEGARDGIDLAHQLNHKFGVPFLFITAFYDEDTLERARSTDPAGYIVKPWDKNNLKANIEIALAKQIPKAVEPQKKLDSFFIKHKSEMIAVKPRDIIYAESYDNYTYVYTETDKYLLSHTLKKVEENLKSAGFARVHKSYLVNLFRIDNISEGQIFLSGKSIPLGRAYKKQLLSQINYI
ncbi:MAG: LytTR family transcriptional regulator DNA-binding domain-containing protein [Balneola sp.]